MVRTLLLGTLLAVAAIFLIVMSPLILMLLSRLKGVDWSYLSEIGQAYGGASAALSALALIGVIASLALQSREHQLNRDMAHRSMRLEIAKLALSDPNVYLPSYGVDPSADDVDQVRLFHFLALIFKYGQLGFLLGRFKEEDIRIEWCEPAFRTNLGREWWKAHRETWKNSALSKSRSEVTFFNIVDKAYLEALQIPAPVTLALGPKNDQRSIPERLRRVAPLAAGVVVGILLSQAIGRRPHQ